MFLKTAFTAPAEFNSLRDRMRLAALKLHRSFSSLTRSFEQAYIPANQSPD